LHILTVGWMASAVAHGIQIKVAFQTANRGARGVRGSRACKLACGSSCWERITRLALYSVSCSRERQLARAASHLDWSDRICMQIAIKTHAARNYTMDLLIAKAHLALSHLPAELWLRARHVVLFAITVFCLLRHIHYNITHTLYAKTERCACLFTARTYRHNATSADPCGLIKLSIFA
jgi:hypothetical protein